MVVVHLLRGLHLHFPAVPNVPVDFPLHRLITAKPWTRLVEGWPLWPHVYFSVIGVTYFLHLDVALSIWFFFTLYKLQEVFLAAYSIPGVNTQQQVMGAVVVLTLVLIWNARRHLSGAVRAAFAGRGQRNDADEPMSYRAAVLGTFAGFAAMGLLCLAAGMSLWMTVLFALLLWALQTVVGWHVTNAGLLLVNVGFAPFEFFTTVLGSRAVGPRNLVLLGFDRSSIPNWSSESLMPYVLQNFRLVDMHGLEARKLRLPLLMSVSVLVAVAAAYITSLAWIYRQGALHLEPWVFVGVGPWGLNRAAAAVQSAAGPNRPGLLSAAIGAATMAGLLFLRHRFLWWPLHPLGYALGVTWAPFHLWFSVLLGWCAKLLVLRLGGFGPYRRLRPLFLGLILGEYLMTAIWSFVGLFTRVSYWGLPH
jgi:hypothetical protein